MPRRRRDSPFALKADELASAAAPRGFFTALRAIGRAWGWRRRMDAGEFATIKELAEAVGLAERHVSRQLRLAYLAPEVMKRLTCAREASAVSLSICVFWQGRLGGSR